MLDNLRKFATTWPGKILGAFLLIGLAGFGITGVISSIGGNTVARVGDRDISSRDFQRAYRTQVNLAAQQIGSTPTPEQAVALGIPGTVLTRLATDEALNILSDDFGLGVSDDKLGEILSNDPAFGGTLGNFDRTVFEQSLRQNGYTENEYFQIRRDAAERQQAALGIFSRIRTPDTVSNIIQRFGEDRRTLEFVVVGEDSLLPIGDPTEDELATYLAENQTDYRTTEERILRTMVLTPEILTETIALVDGDIEAEYERTKQSLVRIETRAISQVQFPTDALARWFELRLESGKSFAELVAETTLTETDLGTLTQAEITDAALADAAFALPGGGVAIVEGVLGKRAIFVSDIQPGGQIALEDVRDDIANRLKLAQARQDYVDILDQIEEQRAAFIDMAQTAEEFGLTIVEAAISPNGAELSRLLQFNGNEADRVATTVYSTELGGLAPSVPLGANKTFWFDLLEIIEAGDQSIDDVRDELITAWVGERRAAALAERAAELVQQLEDLIPFTDMAIANGLFPQTSQPVSRGGDGTEVIDRNIALEAYSGGVDHVSTAQNNRGEYVVFRVISIEAATTDLDQANSDFVEAGYRDDVYSEFANSLRDDAQLRVNQGVLTQVLGISGTVNTGGGHQ